VIQISKREMSGTGELVVEAAVEGVVEPLVRGPALGVRQRLLGLQRAVDDDDIGTRSAIAPPIDENRGSIGAS
jgi:hypothetical protein